MTFKEIITIFYRCKAWVWDLKVGFGPWGWELKVEAEICAFKREFEPQDIGEDGDPSGAATQKLKTTTMAHEIIHVHCPFTFQNNVLIAIIHYNDSNVIHMYNSYKL